MVLEVCERNKIAYYWLSRSEKDDNELRESLRPEYSDWKTKGYKVCVFLSGNGNLVDLTKDLLVHNKEILAEKQVQQSLNTDA